jgi:3-dehydro-L-gulonate 2-dehydrogenase
MIRIPYNDLHAALRGALERVRMRPDRADRCARMFADTTLDGVASHGVARFPRLMKMIANGAVDVRASAERVASHGALERWDGRRGPGNLNASDCMTAAVDLARAHGIGCVALANTNHWMRGGTYGWQAAEAGAMAICWTNTLANLPPWGARDPRVGNNPLVVAAPHPPAHVVLDMAMSQFSFGSLAAYRARGESLPVAGGFDARGELTRDPAAIEDGGRMLPIGFWKGSGLALLLDLFAALLSHGQATHQIAADPERETGLSQVFMAIDVAVAGGSAAATALVDDVLRHLKGNDADAVRYPGERALATRRHNLVEGIPVEEGLWREIVSLSGARS